MRATDVTPPSEPTSRRRPMYVRAEVGNWWPPPSAPESGDRAGFITWRWLTRAPR